MRLLYADWTLSRINSLTLSRIEDGSVRLGYTVIEISTSCDVCVCFKGCGLWLWVYCSLDLSLSKLSIAQSSGKERHTGDYNDYSMVQGKESVKGAQV
jgi:hypothetical protein